MDRAQMESMTLDELYKQHRALDVDVQAKRAAMGEIHDRICQIEEQNFRPTAHAPAQNLSHTNLTEEDLGAWLATLPDKLKDVARKTLGLKG